MCERNMVYVSNPMWMLNVYSLLTNGSVNREFIGIEGTFWEKFPFRSVLLFFLSFVLMVLTGIDRVRLIGGTFCSGDRPLRPTPRGIHRVCWCRIWIPGG